MKKILLVVWTLFVPCLVSFAQTNNFARAAAKQPLPHPAARRAAAPLPGPATTILEQNTDSSPLSHYEDVHAYTLSSRTTQGSLPNDDGTIKRIGHEGLLSPQPAVPASFRPKIIRVGHARIYSSVVTAVARKNPLCLLDGTFLNISF
jgi:hypothetical protein